MVDIKKQKVKGYILLESLVALSLFASIATLLVTQVNQQARQKKEQLRQQEVLSVARMAVQTQKDNLDINGYKVRVSQDEKHISVYHEGKELISVYQK